MNKTVIELFAGVGGFRVGLNGINGFDNDGHAIENGPFSFVWANQWEPSTKVQHAFNCYNLRFPSEHNINEDISLINKKEIPNHTLLCGGFPCQDYSVARSLSSEKGIEGKKGVLWWQIRDILKAKKTPFIFLENVDRLVKSPSTQRGRDFGIMLNCLNELGYAVEWRVINAADYGFPQRRRRIYIFAYKNSTKYYKDVTRNNIQDIILHEGAFARTFAVQDIELTIKQSELNKYSDLVEFSNEYSFKFENSGFMNKGFVYTAKTVPVFEKPITLRQIVVSDASEKYYLDNNRTKAFKKLREKKKVIRHSKSGHEYYYSEGSMSPYDSLDLPGRTMLTSEGSTNRSTHIIMDANTNRLRILTPLECERLNQFPDNWTNVYNNTDSRRYFMMGNALVCGVVHRLGGLINQIIDLED